MWHAGTGSGRLAEQHHLQTLHSDQQTDRLVLAGRWETVGYRFSLNGESFKTETVITKLMLVWFALLEFCDKLSEKCTSP